MKKHHGFTIFLTIGRYGGFYANAYKTGTLRLCLGWIALTICFYDAELMIDDIRNYSKNLNHETTKTKQP